MILGASELQLPAILKAKKMGLEIIVADFNKDAVGFSYADKKYIVSTTDEKAVLEVAKKENVNAIITLASDKPVKTIAYVEKELGIKGSLTYENALCATDKAKMRERLASNNVPVPNYWVVKNQIEFRNIEAQIVFPVVVKPADNSGSRGVSLVTNQIELNKAFHLANENTTNGKVIVEEYMVGPEVSVEVFVSNNIPTVVAVTDKIVTDAPFFVELGHKIPSQLAANYLEGIKKVAISAVESIGIEKGPAHVEIIYTEQGPKIVEIGARLGGDNITTHLVPLSTGVDMVENLINSSIGNEINLKHTKNETSIIKYLTGPKGILKSIRGLEEASKIEGIKIVKIDKKIGEEISEVRSSNDRLGYIICSDKNNQRAEEQLDKAIKNIKLEVK